jgi:hypothetical protein
MAYIINMGDLIRPTRVNVITKEGECKLHIVIDLNINLNTNNIEVKSRQTDNTPEIKEEEEKTEWIIPSFKPGDKVKFGMKE